VSCFAIPLCFATPLPTQIPFCPLLFHYSFMFCCSSMFCYSFAQISISSCPFCLQCVGDLEFNVEFGRKFGSIKLQVSNKFFNYSFVFSLICV
jgi:hypothetical protein